MKNSPFDINQKNVTSAYNNEGRDDIVWPFSIAVMVHSTTTDMQKCLSALNTGTLVTLFHLRCFFYAFNHNSNAALGHGQLIDNQVAKHRHLEGHFNFEFQIYSNEKLDL